MVAYGAGMAATFTGAGLLLLDARDALDRRFSKVRRSWLANVGRLVPIGTAVMILDVGVYLLLRAAVPHLKTARRSWAGAPCWVPPEVDGPKTHHPSCC